MTTLRPELHDLPARIAKLPLDRRGYPVPWFVHSIDGEPEFRAMDREKWLRALRDRLCWVCGEPLGRWLSFVVGPMCGVNRTTSEPPCHLDCAEWSARFCPFLSRPKMVRREDDVINTDKLEANAPGFALSRNPGVALVWTTLSFTLFNASSAGVGHRGVLIEMGEPAHVRWFAHGRRATRAEVELAVASGLPNLQAMADQDPRPELANQFLRACVARLARLYPPEMPPPSLVAASGGGA